MDTKNILIGLVIGVLIGAAVIFFVDQPRFTQLNKQVKALETQVEQLNEAVSAKQVVIDGLEAEVLLKDALEAELDAYRLLLEKYEGYDQLIAKLEQDYNILNLLCANTVYDLEHALKELNKYDQSYEPGCDVDLVYLGLSFPEWWEIYGGPWEQWTSVVYP